MAVNRLRQAPLAENPALDYALVAITGTLAGYVLRTDLQLLWRTVRLIFVA